MKKNHWYLLVTVILLAGVTACGLWSSSSSSPEEEELPLSIESPIANLTNIFTSSVGQTGQIRVTGISGAVVAGAQVTGTNVNTGQSVTIQAGENGQFQFEIEAETGHNITVVAISDEQSETLGFFVKAEDPTPLIVNQSDIGTVKSQDVALVTVSGDSEVSLVKLQLSTGVFQQNFLLHDKAKGANLTDLIGIQVFEPAGLAVLLDRTLGHFYFLNLETMELQGESIEATGNVATMIEQNNLFYEITFDGVEPTEAILREAIEAALNTLNGKITTLPDAGTNLFAKGFISHEKTNLIVASTFSENIALIKFEIIHSSLEVLSKQTLPIQSGIVGGMGIFAEGTRVILANRQKQEALGDNKVFYLCDLTEMTLLQTKLFEGESHELIIDAAGDFAYATLNDKHEVLKINTETFEEETRLATGPFPTRLELDSVSESILSLNFGDTTVSFIRQ